GLDPTRTDNHGALLLHHAAGLRSSSQRMLKNLIMRCRNAVKEKDENGSTPLHCAIAANHQEAAELLLNQGSDTDAQDCSGRTAWDLAELFGSFEIMKLL
ncbi:hypothetical protein CAPTEDRAFT_67380, partial [Capitella teleta]